MTNPSIPITGKSWWTIFSDFINWTEDCYELYKDEHTFCFLSNYPDRMYHVLVIPKIEVDSMRKVPEPYYSQTRKTVKKMSEALILVTWAKRIYQYVEWFQVSHAHVHLYPVNSEEEIEEKFKKWTQLSEEEMKRMQTELIQALKLV